MVFLYSGMIPKLEDPPGLWEAYEIWMGLCSATLSRLSWLVNALVQWMQEDIWGDCNSKNTVAATSSGQYQHHLFLWRIMGSHCLNFAHDTMDDTQPTSEIAILSVKVSRSCQISIWPNHRGLVTGFFLRISGFAEETWLRGWRKCLLCARRGKPNNCLKNL